MTQKDQTVLGSRGAALPTGPCGLCETQEAWGDVHVSSEAAVYGKERKGLSEEIQECLEPNVTRFFQLFLW